VKYDNVLPLVFFPTSTKERLARSVLPACQTGNAAEAGNVAPLCPKSSGMVVGSNGE
jgi:hypothetical protein